MEPLKKFTSFNPAKGAFTLLDEFKAFAFKGNVIDLAVGVIIAGAFGKIIDSFVKNIVLPAIGLLIPSEKGYLAWKFIVGGGKEIPYGLFIGEVVNFLVVAAVLFFFLVKFLSFMMRTKKAEAASAPIIPPLTKEELLLSEIRDILKNRNAHSVS